MTITSKTHNSSSNLGTPDQKRKSKERLIRLKIISAVGNVSTHLKLKFRSRVRSSRTSCWCRICKNIKTFKKVPWVTLCFQTPARPTIQLDCGPFLNQQTSLKAKWSASPLKQKDKPWAGWGRWPSSSTHHGPWGKSLPWTSAGSQQTNTTSTNFGL